MHFENSSSKIYPEILMQIRHLSRDVSISAQLTKEDIRTINAQGFRSIVCNRPDGESVEQPSFAEVAELALSHGMETHYLPVQSGNVEEAEVASFRSLMAALPKPILAYCRTGNRSAALWYAACATKS
jgi:uncharacterized protein (TIGR01244 family)